MKTRLVKLFFVAALIVGVLGATGAAYAAVTINATTVSSDVALTLTGGTASTWSTLVGALTVDSAAALNLGTTNATSVVIGGTGITTTFGGDLVSAVTRATGATGSFQNFAGDLTYQGAAGGTSTYHAGVMGNFLGDTLTNSNATIHAGTIGKYSVTTSDALVGPKAGLVGEAETSVANSAVMAVLGGDGGAITPGAAYGVRSMNSTSGAGFTYGLDLYSAGIGSYLAVSYGTADIRLQNAETISNATDGLISFGGDVLITPVRRAVVTADTKLVQIDANFLTGTTGRTNVLQIDGLRPNGSTFSGSGDDNGIKLTVQNKDVGTQTNYILRGITAEARQDDTATSGTVGKIEGMYITGKTQGIGSTVVTLRGGVIRADADPSTTVSTTAQGLRVELDLDVNAPADSAGIQSFYQSQGAYTTPLAAFQVSALTSRSWQYGLVIDASSVGTADIRLQNGETISNGTDGTIALTGYLVKSTNTALTALAGGAQAGTALTKDINFVTVVATIGDSVQLPVAVVGMDITVVNRAANSLNVFGQTGDGINAGGVNVAYAVATLVEARCIAVATSGATAWECQKSSR